MWGIDPTATKGRGWPAYHRPLPYPLTVNRKGLALTVALSGLQCANMLNIPQGLAPLAMYGRPFGAAEKLAQRDDMRTLFS
jgi:hypothetical protein